MRPHFSGNKNDWASIFFKSSLYEIVNFLISFFEFSRFKFFVLGTKNVFGLSLHHLSKGFEQRSYFFNLNKIVLLNFFKFTFGQKWFI
jgi:hypothetical protein